eukprot:TRINITY_DN3841_c0_g1_i2.p1 TRINITY_DN3841_c0_g1~~TRINITY_DN3841_c0_g1_i2.p1  ORF type:complete len:110 (+),score=3.60 TRINITY_DN3841_c0_g1_i2:508-837(+)
MVQMRSFSSPLYRTCTYLSRTSVSSPFLWIIEEEVIDSRCEYMDKRPFNDGRDSRLAAYPFWARLLRLLQTSLRETVQLDSPAAPIGVFSRLERTRRLSQPLISLSLNQ